VQLREQPLTVANPLWLPTDNGKIRCQIHGETFRKGVSCGGCATAAAPVVVDAEQLDGVPAPAGALTSAELEARFVSIATFAEQQARILLDEPATVGHGVRLIDTVIKALRAAGEHCLDRERMVQTKRLEVALRRVKDSRSFS
jgi:hypothetical protein